MLRLNNIEVIYSNVQVQFGLNAFFHSVIFKQSSMG
jgi:hypothetical protein